MIYAIGDIHGKLEPLWSLGLKIKRHARNYDEPHTVVFLGDYVDRGGEEVEVIEFIEKKPFAGFTHILLRGNHEQMVLDAKNDDMLHNMWYINGGNSTIRSYTYANKPLEHLYNFIHGLPRSFRVGDFYFVHAGIHPHKKLGDQSEHDKLWIRDQFLNHQGKFDQNVTVVHGHTPVQYDPFFTGENKPIVKHNRINVDTGAVWSGILSAAVVDNVGKNLIDIITS